MAKKTFEVPYHPDTGSMCYSIHKDRASGVQFAYRYDSEGRGYRVDPEWRLNIPFNARMKFIHFYENATLQNEKGATFNMFPTELEEILTGGTITDGWVEGTWIVRKRGSHFGIGIAHADEVQV